MYWYLWQFYTILERYSIWILATIIKKVLFLYQEDFQKHIKRTMQLTNFFLKLKTTTFYRDWWRQKQDVYKD